MSDSRRPVAVGVSVAGTMKRMLILFLEHFLVLSLMALVSKGDKLASHHHTSPIGGRSHVYSGRSSIATFSSHGVLKVPVPAGSPNGAPSTSRVHKIHHHPPHLSKLLLKRNQSPSSGSNLFPSDSLAPSPANSYAATIPASLGQPPLSPDVSECCKENMVPKRGSEMCHCVYPIKLELLLLLNATVNSNWSSEFLTELASQLSLHVTQFEITNFYVVGLSRLNITMDIAPHTGISFSASDASEMNLSLSMHKVHLDPSLGDYRLLNFTWFKLPPTPAPIAHSSPAPASPSHSNTKVPTPGSNVNHSSLIIILCIGGAILLVVIISVLIINSCMKKQGKKEVIVSKEPGIPSAFMWMLYGALLVLTIFRWSSSMFHAAAATIISNPT